MACLWLINGVIRSLLTSTGSPSSKHSFKKLGVLDQPPDGSKVFFLLGENSPKIPAGKRINDGADDVVAGKIQRKTMNESMSIFPIRKM